MPLHKDLTGTDLHAPGAHKTQHENGGSDEISVAGLSGLLADEQTPLAHSAAKITSGTLTVARGGTGVDGSSASNGQLLVGNGTGYTLATLTAGANVTITNGAGSIQVAASGGGGGSGAIVQVKNAQTGAVATGSTVIPHDDTIPQNTEGDEYMTLAITPTDAGNKLKIDVVAFASASGASTVVSAALFQDSTANALAAIAETMAVGTGGQILCFSHFMTAGTTSATTFKVRIGPNAGTVTFNGQSGARRYGGVCASSITITEIIP